MEKTFTEEEIKNIKKGAKKIPVHAGDDIGVVLKQLVNLQKEGKYNYYVEIYGNKVYSLDVDYDRDFLKIVGKTEEQLTQEIEEERIRFEKITEELKNDAIQNKDKRIEKGHHEIIEAKWVVFDEFIEKYSKEPYYPYEMDMVIKYVSLLNQELTIEEIADMFIKDHPDAGDHYSSVTATYIAIFHERGIELFETIGKKLHEKGIHVTDSSKEMNRLRNINTLLSEKMDYELAKLIASVTPIDLIINNEEIPCLTKEDGYLIGLDKDNNFVVGRIINDNYICAFITDGFGNVIRYLSSEKDYITEQSNNKNSNVNITEVPMRFVATERPLNEIKTLYEACLKKIDEISPAIMFEVYNEIAELAAPLKDDEDTLTIAAIIDLQKSRGNKLNLKPEAQ